MEVGINWEAVRWLENEGAMPRRGGDRYLWDCYSSAWGGLEPRPVTHHALIEEYDIDPEAEVTVLANGGLTFADSGTPNRWWPEADRNMWDRGGYPISDPSLDVLGPSYSQAYADRHQIPDAVNAMACSNDTPDRPDKPGQNASRSGENNPALPRRGRRGTGGGEGALHAGASLPPPP